MSLFRCPVCFAPLERGERAYTCPNGHSYDISKEGYVHLLPANQKHSKAPGDDKAMVAARNRFLSAGYYAPLRQTLEELALRYTAPGCAVLDSGCGEGWYTAGVAQALRAAGRSPRVAGIDISKFALRWAARRDRETEFAVGSAYHLPAADGCADLLINCFSPLAAAEFRRVLVPSGVFLYVVPAPRHLWEMKEVLYDRPYPNPEEEIPYEGFEPLEVVPVESVLHIGDPEDLWALFQMTPYCWKTPKTGVERLQALPGLDVTAGFRIHVFRKK
ncbi:putative RNA methyltransferase [Pseudoflavonifractor sp. MSJ-37]|uniref:putative RNA methyltransferase n=1 Tax=Pseudoflavonifractor sp. MSJ-37 TaxID=2841531 RepID=UPI001C0FB6B2|nr:methyltransferase domain-containing protein [Pseudoflavonifractor sp. MSJ-37]MBU5436074.1 methyltransferase domain-containing protein [Pseudoflavonifractor sp. MSJ-37]